MLKIHIEYTKQPLKSNYHARVHNKQPPIKADKINAIDKPLGERVSFQCVS